MLEIISHFVLSRVVYHPNFMSDRLYQKFFRRWDEVTELPPQTAGLFTPVFKRVAPFFKIAPWRIILPFALMITAASVFFMEVTASEIASLLQRGF